MTQQITLTKGYVALVDDEDHARLVSMGRWYAAPDGRTVYAGRNRKVGPNKYRTVLMHAVITGWDYVDHINGDGLDNRRANLRQATRSQNHGNRRTPISNTSGYKGVHWDPATEKWRARIGFQGQRLGLGFYEDAVDAARAYDRAALELFGEFARPNFPQETR